MTLFRCDIYWESQSACVIFGREVEERERASFLITGHGERCSPHFSQWIQHKITRESILLPVLQHLRQWGGTILCSLVQRYFLDIYWWHETKHNEPVSQIITENVTGPPWQLLLWNSALCLRSPTCKVTALNALEVGVDPEQFPQFIVQSQSYWSDQSSSEQRFSLGPIETGSFDLSWSLLHCGEIHVPAEEHRHIYIV